MRCPLTNCHDEPFDDMLTTHVYERNMDVATNLRYPFWTGIWRRHDDQEENWNVGSLLWVHSYLLPRDIRGQHGGGGLAEAHMSVVEKVKKGLLPPPEEDKARVEV